MALKRVGKCLIAHAKRGSKEVLLVMLNAPNRWWDADGLINRAFDENLQ
jgi:D-alanyl-D-alanine carboxypeptidase